MSFLNELTSIIDETVLDHIPTWVATSVFDSISTTLIAFRTHQLSASVAFWHVLVLLVGFRLSRPVGVDPLSVCNHRLRKLALPLLNDVKREPLLELVTNLIEVYFVLIFKIVNVQLLLGVPIPR